MEGGEEVEVRWRVGRGTWATSMEQLAELTDEETPASTRPTVSTSRLDNNYQLHPVSRLFVTNF